MTSINTSRTRYTTHKPETRKTDSKQIHSSSLVGSAGTTLCYMAMLFSVFCYGLCKKAPHSPFAICRRTPAVLTASLQTSRRQGRLRSCSDVAPGVGARRGRVQRARRMVVIFRGAAAAHPPRHRQMLDLDQIMRRRRAVDP